MTERDLPVAAEEYLQRLEAALARVPAASRADIVGDVRDHILDATGEGRGVDAVLAGLGDPSDVARLARAELAPPARRSLPIEQGARIMQIVAVGVALVVAVLISFVMSATSALADDGSGYSNVTIFGGYGALAAVLTLLPAIIAAVPLLVPPGARPLATIVAAAAVTAIWSLGSLAGASSFVAVVPLLWAGIGLRWAAPRGLPTETARIWRVVIGVVIVLTAFLLQPVALLLAIVGAGQGGGATASTVVTMLVAVAGIVLGGLVARGMRWAYVATAVLGAVAMIVDAVATEFVFSALWMVGGIWLAIGLAVSFASRAGVTRDEAAELDA